MARLHWLEAVLPLGIIGGMLCIMGNAQYFIHKAAHGRVRRLRLPSPSPAPAHPLSLDSPYSVLTRAAGFFSLSVYV